MKNVITYFFAITLCLPFSQKSKAQANTSLSNLAAPTKISVALLPNSANTKNIGSTNKTWKDLYMNGIIYKEGTNWIAGSKYSGNTLLGSSAGYNMVNSGSTNQNCTVVGFNAGFATTTGVANTFVGASAGQYNTTGGSNTFVGDDAGRDNTTGEANTFLGIAAGTRNLSGRYNIAIGRVAGGFNKTGNSNTWVGNEAGYLNSTGSHNTMMGDSAGRVSTAYYNTMMGSKSGANTTAGSSNAFFGYSAGLNNTLGSANTGIGSYALYDNAASGGNTALGYSTGSYCTNGSYNTFLGYDADANSANLTNSTALGFQSRITASNQVRIGNSSVTSIGGYANWTNISDGRYKNNIKENVPGLTFINKLKPVTYHLNITGIEEHLRAANGIKGDDKQQETPAMAADREAKQKALFTGFVAQDVEKAAKELGYEFSGVDAPKNESGLYGLRYSEFVVPLVKAVQELSKMNIEKDELIARQQLMLNKITERLNALEKKAGMAQQAADVSAIKDVSSNTSLAQNTANPFSNNTIIRYNIPANKSAAQLVITDTKGQVIKTFSLSGKGAGQVTVEAGNLAAGNYFYSLVIDGKKIDTKQMAVLK